MDEIIFDYQSGVSLRTLGKKYGVSVNTVRDRLKKEYPLFYQPPPFMPRRWFGEEKERLIEMYLSGASMRQICAEFNIKRKRVSTLLDQFGVRKKRKKRENCKKRRWFGEEKERFIEMCSSGASINQISAEFNIGRSRTYELINQFGISKENKSKG